jgi:SWI/SNF chromatin-remodeling complex subunit SWI1
MIADARKVSLMQGLLAADILASLADCTLARLWLESADKFSHHLLRLSYILSSERTPSANQRSHSTRGQVDADVHTYGSIINRGLTILRRLAEKSKQADTTSNHHVPSSVFLKKENLLYALLAPNLDAGVVRQLVTYAGLGT